MAMAQRTNPDVADYFIKGYLSIERGQDGKPVYKLSDIQKRGISFDDPGPVMRGLETDKEDVRFQFSHYATDYPGGINTPLDFWRYDESIHEWQPDVETRQGNAGVQEKKSMVLMLVLDCSASLSTDFSFVQEAAKDFIKSLLDASKEGNIRIGIVGFSKISETEFYPITRLTIDSYFDMCMFINRKKVQNGTALYYAMDKAIDAMEAYCATSIPSDEPLSSAMMVTFTDGLDQTSRDESKGIYTADDYYFELQRKMNNKKIDGVPLQSKMRGVRGIDIATDAQLGKFSQIGNSLAEFKLLGSVSELGKEFKYIADGLINEWRVLNCYVPNSFKGRVAWTYPSRKPVVVEKPKEPKQKGKFLFGINAGIGMAVNKGAAGYTIYNIINSNGFTGTIGLDFAFPVSETVNFGVFTSFGYIKDKDWHDQATINVGPLLLVQLKQSGSLYIGGGVHLGFDVDNLDHEPATNFIGGGARIGYKFKNGLYLFLEENIYVGERFSYDYYSHINGNSTLFHVGYMF